MEIKELKDYFDIKNVKECPQDPSRYLDCIGGNCINCWFAYLQEQINKTK